MNLLNLQENLADSHSFIDYWLLVGCYENSEKQRKWEVSLLLVWPTPLLLSHLQEITMNSAVDRLLRTMNIFSQRNLIFNKVAQILVSLKASVKASWDTKDIAFTIFCEQFLLISDIIVWVITLVAMWRRYSNHWQ